MATSRTSDSNSQSSNAPNTEARSSHAGAWSRHLSSCGRYYYFNENTGQSQWTPPEGLEYLRRSESLTQPLPCRVKTEASTDPRDRRASTGTVVADKKDGSTEMLLSPVALQSKDNLAATLADMAKQSKLDLDAPDIMTTVMSMLDQSSMATAAKEASAVNEGTPPPTTTTTTVAEETSVAEDADRPEVESKPVESAEHKERTAKKNAFDWNDALDFAEPVSSLISAEMAEMKGRLEKNEVDVLRSDRLQLCRQLFGLKKEILCSTTKERMLAIDIQLSKQKLFLLEAKSELKKRRISDPSD